MSPVDRRVGRVNEPLEAFLGAQQQLVAAAIEATLGMVGRFLDEQDWRRPAVEDGVIIETLTQRYAGRLSATALKQIETRIMRRTFSRACGRDMLRQYGESYQRRIVDVIFAIDDDRLELRDWTEWERAAEDEVAIAIQLFSRMTSGQIRQLQSVLDVFNECRETEVEKLEAAGCKKLVVTRRKVPEIERHRKAISEVLMNLGERQAQVVEDLLKGEKYLAVAKVIVPKVT